ncbi:MAG: hypothetical protein LBQ62_01700 [Candidatus Accumulibacter sp.]|nr:hypothetical protein [Accumulibacter sp.]
MLSTLVHDGPSLVIAKTFRPAAIQTDLEGALSFQKAVLDLTDIPDINVVKAQANALLNELRKAEGLKLHNGAITWIGFVASQGIVGILIRFVDLADNASGIVVGEEPGRVARTVRPAFEAAVETVGDCLDDRPGLTGFRSDMRDSSKRVDNLVPCNL